MFSQFLNSTSENPYAFVIWISIIFTVNNFIAFTLWTILGDSLARVFRNEGNAKVLNTVFGSMLALVAIWMFFV